MLLVVKNRPGELARQELRQAWKRTARQNLSTLLVAGGVSIAYVVFLFLMPMPLWMRTFMLGIFVTAMLCALAWVLHLSTGGHNRYLGKIGEEMTAEAVLNRRRRWKGGGWSTASTFVATAMSTMCSSGPAGSSLLSPNGPQFPGGLIRMDSPDQRIVTPCFRPAMVCTRSRDCFATGRSASTWSSIQS